MAVDLLHTSPMVHSVMENCSSAIGNTQGCTHLDTVVGATMSAMAENLTSLNASAWEGLKDVMGLSSANTSGSVSLAPPGEDGEEEDQSILISKRVRDIIIIINMAILCQAISVFGIVANIVNIVVFIKQGFRDAMTVTLTGLAVADLGVSTCAVWLSICYNPLFQQLELPFLPLQIVYLTAGLPRLSCSRVSSWVLALATFERCLCIAMPFKVREIITPRRTLIFVVSIFITMTASVAPIYYTSRTAQKFDAAANRSYLVLSFTEDREKVDAIAFGIGVTLSVCSFVAVAVCTAVLVYSLKKTSKWRESAIASGTGKDQSEKSGNAQRAGAEQVELSTEDSEISTKTFTSVASLSADNGQKDYHRPAPNHSAPPTAVEIKKRAANEVSAKNKKAGKMVSMISIIFIVCYTPNVINQLVMSLVPDYAKNGRYINTNQVFWSVGFLTESLNASINIFMYYTMSTKFRSTIQGMMCARCQRPGEAGRAAAEDQEDAPKVKKISN